MQSSNDIAKARLLSDIRARALACCDNSDTAHDELHLRRVVANAKSLMSALATHECAVDPFVVEAACWLHDCVHLPKGQGQPGVAARASANSASVFLEALGIQTDIVRSIAAAIETHSYSGGLRPVSLEGAIVQDADRLDALGAIGIARFWVTMVSMGGRMYDPDDPAAEDRAIDDRAWALDHIERKLLRLEELMNTLAGQTEAKRRTEFIRTYRDEFLRELGSLEQT